MRTGITLLRIIIILFVFSSHYSTAFALTATGKGHVCRLAEADPQAISNRKSAPPSINLTIFPFESRIARLSWTTTPPVTDGIYYVERHDEASITWVTLAQIPYNGALNYDDTVSYPYCSDTNLFYRIRYESADPANNTFSNEESAVLRDITNPAVVKNVIVTITPTSYPQVSWSQVTDDDIFGYTVQRDNGFGWPFITTVPADSSSYIDVTVNQVCDTSYKYIILTFDRCMNRSTPDYDLFVQTIKLDLPPIDECERLAKLSWNPYYVMPGGLGGYRVYRMIDNGTAVEIANINDTLVTSYNDPFQFDNGHNYTYFVQAYSASGVLTSSSCKRGHLYTGANVPDSVYITGLTVVSDSYIKLDYYSTPDKTIKLLILERSADGGVTYQAIDTLSVFGDFVPQNSYFEDKTADVHYRSYYYRLVALDFCGTVSINSNISRSVFLQCTASQTENTIDWNSYESWLKEVEGYRVYRTVNGEPPFGELIGSVTPVTLSFPDQLTNIDPTKQVCYWVVAEENPGNPYLNDATSQSNTCCIIKGATMYLPNAFHPGGTNDRFRPVATFVDPQSFNMTIFSRGGQQIFETTNMVEGWNGLIDGQLAPLGLYSYVITYTSLGGQDYTKRGTVLIVR